MPLLHVPPPLHPQATWGAADPAWATFWAAAAPRSCPWMWQRCTCPLVLWRPRRSRGRSSRSSSERLRPLPMPTCKQVECTFDVQGIYMAQLVHGAVTLVGRNEARNEVRAAPRAALRLPPPLRRRVRRRLLRAPAPLRGASRSSCRRAATRPARWKRRRPPARPAAAPPTLQMQP